MLTQKRLKKLFYYDPLFGVFVWLNRPVEDFKTVRTGKMWNTKYADTIAGYKKPDGYIPIEIDGVNYLAHRLAFLYVYGYLPPYPEYEIDHIDQCPSHNWITNLRVVGKSDNKKNTGNRKDNKSGVRGVYYIKQSEKYIAQTSFNGKQKYIGAYNNFDDAVWARWQAEIKHGYTNCYTTSPAYKYLKEHNKI